MPSLLQREPDVLTCIALACHLVGMSVQLLLVEGRHSRPGCLLRQPEGESEALTSTLPSLLRPLQFFRLVSLGLVVFLDALLVPPGSPCPPPRFPRALARLPASSPDLESSFLARLCLCAFVCTPPPANKPRGLHAARKLRTDRREARWVRHPCSAYWSIPERATRSRKALSSLPSSRRPLFFCDTRPTSRTRSVRLATFTGPRPPEDPPTPRASSSRRLELRPSSPTRPSASASVSSSSRTARRSPPSSPTTVAL
jgi:hypothetical protein